MIAADPERLIRSILAEPAYARASGEPSLAPSLWDRLLTWLAHALRPLLAGVGAALDRSQAFGAVLGVVLIALALGAIVVVAARLIVGSVRVRERVSARSAGASGARARTSAQWYADACARAAAGDDRGAVAMLFLAALALLDESGLVRFDRSRTPGEYRSVVRATRASAAPPFDSLARAFTLATYARATGDAADFAAARSAFDAFAPLVRS